MLDMRANAPQRDQAVHLSVSNVLGVENRGYSRRPGAMRGVGVGNNPKGITACSMVHGLPVLHRRVPRPHSSGGSGGRRTR